MFSLPYTKMHIGTQVVHVLSLSYLPIDPAVEEAEWGIDRYPVLVRSTHRCAVVDCERWVWVGPHLHSLS